MPIYEFYCDSCNVVFNFFSSRVNTEKQPDCPRCGREKIQKMMSTFATIGKASEESGDDPLAGIDESRMEQAFEGLMRDADGVNEDDPRQMAALMRKFSEKTGLGLGEQMEEALSRLESGDDPEQVEQEMGALMDSDDAFTLEGMKKKIRSGPQPPVYDDRLYEL
ncbi:FmdB family zinc ribbon protein [Desulfogranum mediterraneum]|uniref:FmdB family zinc ribbon protein n=1 Tax=Desulfogranum mediterraneum TaxID=160661 RepID=UPI0003FFCB55|nr:FmdB family zinc ribbon protein [Desulfogranum mediterraneum]